MSCAELYRQSQSADLELQTQQFEQFYRGKKGAEPGCFNLDPASYYRDPNVGCAAPITDFAMGAWKAPSVSGWQCNVIHAKRLKQKGGGRATNKKSKPKRKGKGHRRSSKHCGRLIAPINPSQHHAATFEINQVGEPSGYYMNLNDRVAGHPVYGVHDNNLRQPTLKPVKHLESYSFKCSQPCWGKACL